MPDTSESRPMEIMTANDKKKGEIIPRSYRSKWKLS